MAATALAEYWSKKWEVGALCDVTIKCKDAKRSKEIKCHSFILAPASPILEKLSGGEMVDERSRTPRAKGALKARDKSGPRISLGKTGNSIVEFPAVSYAEWQTFLNFLYYGKVCVEKLEPALRSNSGESLRSAAEKLQVHESLRKAASWRDKSEVTPHGSPSNKEGQNTLETTSQRSSPSQDKAAAKHVQGLLKEVKDPVSPRETQPQTTSRNAVEEAVLPPTEAGDNLQEICTEVCVPDDGTDAQTPARTPHRTVIVKLELEPVDGVIKRLNAAAFRGKNKRTEDIATSGGRVVKEVAASSKPAGDGSTDVDVSTNVISSVEPTESYSATTAETFEFDVITLTERSSGTAAVDQVDEPSSPRPVEYQGAPLSTLNELVVPSSGEEKELYVAVLSEPTESGVVPSDDDVMEINATVTVEQDTPGDIKSDVGGAVGVDNELDSIKSVCVFCWKMDRACTKAVSYKCFLCNNVLNKEELNEHVHSSHPGLGKGYFTCCGKKETMPKELGIVGKTVYTVLDGTKYASYVCELCAYASSVLVTFRLHLANKHGVKATVSNYTPRCKNCLVFLSNSTVKEDHEHFCMGHELPMCTKCDSKFPSPCALKRHSNIEHPVNPKSKIIRKHKEGLEGACEDTESDHEKPLKKVRRTRQAKKSLPDKIVNITGSWEEKACDDSQGIEVPPGDTDEKEAGGILDDRSRAPDFVPDEPVRSSVVGATQDPMASGDEAVIAEYSASSPTVRHDADDIGTGEQLLDGVNEPEVEGQRSDRSSVCLHCWNRNKICTEDAELLCFMCFEIVSGAELDQHTHEFHPQCVTGFFTCRGGKLNKFNTASGIVGKRVVRSENPVDVRHACNICSFSASMIQMLKKHIQEKHEINTASYNVLYRCRSCPLYFANSTWHENHEYFCSGLGFPKCLACNLKFMHPVALREHRAEVHGLYRRKRPAKAKQSYGANVDEDQVLAERNGGEQAGVVGGGEDSSHPPVAVKLSYGGCPITEENRHVKGKSERKKRKREASPTIDNGEVEGQRSDRKSMCLYCWKSSKLCNEAESLKCFLCLRAVASEDLDVHTKVEHPDLEFGLFTCQGKRKVVLSSHYGIVAKKFVGQEKYECELCHVIMPDPKSLKLHLVEHHRLKAKDSSLSQIARCRHCMYYFSNIVAAEDHQFFCRGVSESELPQCRQCGVKFSSPNAYRRHMKSIHLEVRKTNLDSYAEAMAIEEKKNLTPFSFTNRAKEPNLEFDRPDRKSLCVHCWKVNVVCQEAEWLKCFVCFDTVHQTHADEHALKHPNSNAGLYTCLGIHNSKFINSKEIYGTVGQRIVATQQDQPDVYKCRVCMFATENLQHFKNHLAVNHAVKISKSNFIPRCRYCYLYFTANSVQEDHEYFCRGADLPYCEECQVKFASPNAWRRHINEEHVGKYGPRKYFSNANYNKSLLCDLCGESFKNKAAMKYHNKTKHSGKIVVPYEERPKHICDFCGASFLRQHTLKEHVNFRHTKARQFNCKLCDRSFLRKSELARHELNHSKLIAIKCSMCNFQGFTKYELKRHFFKDHKIGQFKCTCCSAKFTDYDKYEDHKFLKLCPRYRVATGTRKQRKPKITVQGTDDFVPSDLTQTTVIGGKENSQVYTWVTPSGEVVQGYIKKEAIVSDEESQKEGFQLVELPSGEMQLAVKMSGNQMELVQVEEGHIEGEVNVAQIQEGNVQLVQIEDGQIQDGHLHEGEIHQLKQTYGPLVNAEESHVQNRPLQIVHEIGGKQLKIEDSKIIGQSETPLVRFDNHDEEQKVCVQVQGQNDRNYVHIKIANDEDQSQLTEVTTEHYAQIQEDSKEFHVQIQEQTAQEESKQAQSQDQDSVQIQEQGDQAYLEVEQQDGQVVQYQVQEETADDTENVMEMSLEAFQEAYGVSALEAVEREQGQDGSYYVVYV